MKVLHLIGGGDVGGAKAHVLSLIKALSRFIDVKLISYRPGPFYHAGLEMGIDIEVIKLRTITGDIKRTLDIIKKGNYQILHSHGAKANMISAIISKLINIPTVTTIHSDYKLDYLGNAFKHLSFGIINRIAIRSIDYHIGVSENFRQMLINRGFNQNKIFTVYNGIDFNKQIAVTDKQHFLNKHGIQSDGSILVGILARLYPVKDIDTFLSAASILLTEFNNIRFLIGGDGPEMSRLITLSESLGINDKVHFLGYIDNPDDFMQVIDINVLTSISESFPYVILEGARAGKPTISTAVGGISDLIEHRSNGLLFETGNREQLAGSIKELVTDKSLMEQFGANIYAFAKQYFSLENMCETQLSIYNTILSLPSNKKR